MPFHYKHPMPRIDNTLRDLTEYNYFLAMDLDSGNVQLKFQKMYLIFSLLIALSAKFQWVCYLLVFLLGSIHIPSYDVQFISKT